MISGAIATSAFFLIVPIVAAYHKMQVPPTDIVLLAIAAGVLVQLSQALYFHSLSLTQVGIVAAYWNFLPVFAPIVGAFFFGELLTSWQYFGILILVMASICFYQLDANLETRKISVSLMMAACILQSFAYHFQSIIYSQSDFPSSFFFIILGLVVAGIAPLVLPGVRREYLNEQMLMASTQSIIFVIELINLLALLSLQAAISFGKASLVAAVETTIPAYVFLLAVAFSLILGNSWYSEHVHNGTTKFALIGIMVIGILLIS